MRFKLFTGVAVVAALLAPQSASAQLVPTGLSCTLASVAMGASGCIGAYNGNDTGQQADILAKLALDFGGSWTSLGKTDDANFGPFTSNPTNVNSGTLSFDMPRTGPFALLLKTSTEFSIYYFANAGTVSSVNFNTVGTSQNNQGVGRDLSHARLYTGSGSMNVVPEPSTYALMATGMIGLVGFARRRRQA